MRRLAVVALLLGSALAGCSTYTSERERTPLTAAQLREAEVQSIKAQIALKREDIKNNEADRARIDKERIELAQQPPSEMKTNRLVELARLEVETTQQREALEVDIEELETRLDPSRRRVRKGGPRKADESLDEILALAETKDKAEEERRMKRAEEERATQRVALAEAEAARAAEQARREKEKLKSTGPGVAGAAFEEQFDSLIIAIKAELQKYKRW